jgi:hypothetical protein
MNKLGAQVTETDPTTDNAYLVTQLEAGPDGRYSDTGGRYWVDKAKPNPEDRMKQAVKDCLTNKFSGHRTS